MVQIVVRLSTDPLIQKGMVGNEAYIKGDIALLFEEAPSPLNHLTVEDVVVIEPGQGYIYSPSGPTGKTEEIVGEPTTEPAAAGEVEPRDYLDVGQFASVEQFGRIAPVIREMFPGMDVYDMKLHQTTTIVAQVKFSGGEVGFITVSLPNDIAAILE